jgi:hypothetical protein
MEYGLRRHSAAATALWAPAERGETQALLTLQSVRRVASVVTDDEDTHGIANNSIEEVVRKAAQVDAPEIAFVNMISIRPPGSIEHQMTQFAVEIVGQFRMLGAFVIIHDLFYIGANPPM